METLKCIDFRNADFGLLVTRSPHYLKDRCVKRKRREIGLMVERRHYETVIGSVQTWPVIHWEGAVMSSICHPALVVPLRRHSLPAVECHELKCDQLKPIAPARRKPQLSIG